VDYEIQGSTPSLFVGTTAFEVIVKQQIRRLEEPALRCCQLVYDELIRILGQLLVKTVSITSGDFQNQERWSSLFDVAVIVQAIPGTARQVQRGRHQLFQGIDGAHEQAGDGYGSVSPRGPNVSKQGRLAYFTPQDASLLR
jgi:hypothetical protein